MENFKFIIENFPNLRYLSHVLDIIGLENNVLPQANLFKGRHKFFLDRDILPGDNGTSMIVVTDIIS